MNYLKNLIAKYFSSFSYFYSHLRYRVFIALSLSLFVGVLDGFGLAMFLPLLQMLDDNSSSVDSSQMGNLSFLVDGFHSLDIPLNLYNVLLIILCFFSLKGIIKFFESYLRIIYQQYFISNIRISNAIYLSDFNYDKFINSDSGRIQNTFSGEAERVSAAYTTYFRAIQAGVLVFVYVILAFLSNPQFAILVAIGAVLTNFIFKKLYLATKTASRKLTSKNHVFQGLLIQKVANFKYLKATALIYKYRDKLIENIKHIENYQKRIGILSAVMQSMREPLTMLIVVAVILIQVKFFAENLGLIILSLLFFYRALTFLISAQGFWNNFLAVSGSLENMTSFAEELKENQEQYGSIVFKGFERSIEVKSVYYSYNNNLAVLNRINLCVEKNKTMAIIGESGSGKTTLMNMLSGLIKPETGDVLVDGVKVKDLDVRTFQKKIGYITQEPVIFNDTIFNNVTFWAEKNIENIFRFNKALKEATIYHFIQTLPNRENELLGNNGINLSGGQRQRISIARELYKEVDFLMMDEATSALDSETEKAIQQNIEALKGQYTIIIIAHRLSTVKNADKIVLLKRGSIEETGGFEELQKKSKVFQRMVGLQEF